jgi:UDP-galactopyranose mutase
MKIIEAENLTFSKKENNNTFDDVKAIIIPKEVYQKQIDDYTVKIWELEDRIYKAIEYIESATKEIAFENDKLIDILEILKGKDE